MRLFKLIAVLALSAMLAICAGCGSNNASNSKGSTTKQSGPVNMEKYPEKTIKMVMTHGIGSDTDANSKLLAKLMSKELGQQVEPYSLTGAHGTIAMKQYNHKGNDGYLILATNTATLIGSEAMGLVDFSYDAYEPIAIYGRQASEYIVVRADAPYNNIQELIEATKAAPETIRYGAYMAGDVYLSSIIMEQTLGAKFKVLTAGNAETRLTTLMYDQMDVVSAPYDAVKKYLDSGDLKIIGNISSMRCELLKDMPCTKDIYPDLYADNFYVVVAPKGTDPAVVQKLNEVICNIVNNDPEYREECIRLNHEVPWALNVEDTIKVLKAQREHYMKYSEQLSHHDPKKYTPLAE